MLHVSQSAISTSISRLEKELGVELFCKDGRNIKLTENGSRFVDMITPAVAELDFAKNEMLSSCHIEPNTVVLSVEVTDFASELERIYYRVRPEARFRQSMDPTELALQKLRCNTVDFCLSYEPANDPEIVSELVCHDRVLAQMACTHPLAQRNSLWLGELAEDSFICLSRDFGFRRWMESMCFLAGFRPKTVFEVCDTSAIMAQLLVRNSVSFIAESTWKCLGMQSPTASKGNDPIVAIPLKDAFCERSCYLQYHRSRIHSPEAREFREFAHQLYGSMDEFHDIFRAEQEVLRRHGICIETEGR